MFNVRLAGGHLYGRQLFTWLSLVVSLMASFVLSFFPLDALDEIWDLIESVSGGFLTYSCNLNENMASFYSIVKTSVKNTFVFVSTGFYKYVLNKELYYLRINYRFEKKTRFHCLNIR